MKIPEEEIGISVYWTEGIPGIGGKLKKRPEDFIVEEKSLLPPEDPDGELAAVIIRHRLWEMNRLIRRLSTNLRIGRGGIGFAGTKDKRAIATQLMTLPVPLEALATISIPDVKFLSMYRTRTPTRLGALLGNCFRISIGDVDREDLEERVESITSEIDALGGFPNFFGAQRFGVARPITHLIGKAMTENDFEKAAMIYLSEDTEFEAEDCRRARECIAETRDFKEGLKRFPNHMIFERTILSHLSHHPDDFSGAIKKLPRNLIMMFVHAYQSFLFNRILSRRISMKLPLNRPVDGDLILPLDKHGLPDRRRQILVTDANLERAEKQIIDGLGFVSGLLFGSKSTFAEGVMGEIERKMVEEESIDQEDFIIPNLMAASSKGMRRELLAPVRNLGYKNYPDRAYFSFELNKGCYATSLLREYMKAELIAY